MTSSHRSLLVAVLLLLPTSAVRLPAQSEAAASPDLRPQKQTIADIRSVGTAMWMWLADQSGKTPDQLREAASSSPEITSVALGEVPVISREKLAEILVPRYIAAIPGKDGWGHPYEYRLNVGNPKAQHVMALRSPGQDGQFSGETYEVGGFPATDLGQDLAWSDGFFVRWPAAVQPSK